MSHRGPTAAIRFLRFHSKRRAVDVSGDRVAILGVSLWATFPALVPPNPGDKLLLRG